jgi:sugar/nucleoside kinase (ribokinase family)
MEQYDVVGLGNAIVDVLAYTEDSFLHDNQLPKGGMTLIDAERASQLYKIMGAATECSGGSAANTLAGIASLGGKAAFIGKVAKDQMGKIFRHDMNATGVHFTTPPLLGEVSTAQCLVMVTNDAATKHTERTMATYLGACKHISPIDIDAALIEASKVTYLEGYLWDEQPAKRAIEKAIEVAHAAKKKVSFTLSDAFCVERHREEFWNMIKRRQIDILFANEREACALAEVSDMNQAITKLQGTCEIVAITRSEKGSVILTKNDALTVPAAPVSEVFDVTGAGDLYAAGFLYGYTHDLSLEKCGKLGSLAAGEIIKYLGARPMSKLSPLVEKLAA